MKKNILALAVLSFTLFSCENASGGNKNILPTDDQAVQTKSATEGKVQADSAKTAPTEVVKEKVDNPVQIDSTKIKSKETKN